MARQSCGARTSNSMGRVACSPSTCMAAARETPKVVHRFHSGFQASTASSSMKVAKASLSQMPFHQVMVTRSPNHMWASSWATTSAMRSSSAWEAAASSTSERGLAEGDGAQVLHGPRGEVGNGEEIDLVARIGQPVVALEEVEREGAARRGRSGPDASCPARTTRAAASAPPSTGSVASSSPTTKATEVGRHADGVGEVDGPSAVPSGSSRTMAQLDTAARPSATTRVTPKTALNAGSSQHGKPRRASVASNCVAAMVWAAPAASLYVLR